MIFNLFNRNEPVDLTAKHEARATAIRKTVKQVADTKACLDAYIETESCVDMIRFQGLLDDYVAACVNEREARSVV